MKQSDSYNFFHNRLTGDYKYSPELTVRMDVRNRLFWGESIENPYFSRAINVKPGILGMSEIILEGPGILLHSVIDRLSVQYSSGSMKYTVGRQRINWGMHTIWNPNDIFNTYNILDFDYEERPGCDAIRLQHVNSEYTLELAIKPDSSIATSIGAVMFRTNYSGYDMQLLAGQYKSDIIFGGGWAGNIGDAGFKGEFTYFHPYHDSESTNSTVSCSIQFDQTFENNWYCSIGALYNGNASTQSLLSLSTSTLSPKNLFPFESSLFIGFSKQFSPIHGVGCSIIYSPTNNSLIALPTMSYNVIENIDIDLIGQLFFMKDSMQEYSNIATSVFFRSRWSF
jgi:hypothetical protein